MFGKFFASAFTGSMMASGADVFALWGYVIANAAGSRVELNPKLIALLIGTTPEKIEESIKFLCAPDPNSRSKNDDGCRLIREGEYQYFVPNHEKYRSIRDEEGRREYNRLKQQEHRSKLKGDVKRPVNDSQSLLPKSTMSANTEADTDTKLTPLSGKPDEPQINGKKKLSESCLEVLEFLNEKTGRRYQPVKANINLIACRLREGATVDQCRQVIAKKCREWRDDPNQEIYLRPKTLFNATNFANYQGELT